MNTALEARKNIKYLASVLRGLVAFDEELEAIGSFEKLATQKQAVVADLARQEGDARKRLDGLAVEHAAALKNAESQVEALTASAATVLAETEARRQDGIDALARARDEITAMKRVAATEAEGVIEAARAQAKAIAADTDAHMRGEHAAASKALDALRREAETTRAEKTALDAEIKAKTADRDAIVVEIEALKKRFA